jgi:hypothetical protein
MRRGLILLGLLAVLWGGCSQPAAVAVEAPVLVRSWVASRDVTPGRDFWLSVEVNRRQDVTFELPDIGASIQGLSVLDEEVQPEQQAGDRILSTRRLKLKAPKTGTYLIPGVEAPWKTPDNQVGTAGTGSILIEAGHSGGDDPADQALRPLKAAAEPDARFSAVGISAAVAAIAGIALFAAWLIRRRKAVVAPPVPPWERARSELAELGRLPTRSPEQQAAFAYRVSATLRRYLEDRFGFPAWKMTTAEVLRSLPRELAAQMNLEQAIRQVLEASDEVKFAGRGVEERALAGWIARCSEVVEATVPAVETEEAA